MSRLREQVRERPMPEPKEQGSFAGLKVGQRLTGGWTPPDRPFFFEAPTFAVVRCTDQFALLSSGDWELKLTDRQWKDHGWTKVPKARKKKGASS